MKITFSRLPMRACGRPEFGISLLIIICCVSSCAPGPPPIAGVTGTVTFQGTPLTEGVVIFVSNEGFGSSALIQPDGGYLMQSHHGRGIPLGEYSITVTPPEEAYTGDDEPVRKRDAFPQIPRKYRQFETSPLRYTVIAGDNNQFDIAMTP